MKKILKSEVVQDTEVSENIEDVDCKFCRYGGERHQCSSYGFTARCQGEMTEEDCEKFKGHCSEACLIFDTIELPRIMREKQAAGMHCCSDYNCTKCLLVCCDHDDCPTHSLWAKNARKAVFADRAKQNEK